MTWRPFDKSDRVLHDTPEARDDVMTMTATDNLAIARRYLVPNRLSPIGVHRDLKALLDSAKKGKKTLRAQKYDILNSIVDGDSVALEVFWSGYLAAPVDTLPADSEMRAHLSIWLEFKDGKICRQHNYDCFDPWWV